MWSSATMNCLVSTALAASNRCWYVVVLFSLVSRYFLIFLVIYSLTHWLFKSVLFNFYV